MLKLFYELGYRYWRMPWDGGPRSELVELVRSGRLEPCRALDLGCGSGANAVFLAKHGFEVTGVDFAAAALHKADRLAKAAGVGVVWVRDDLTRLQRIGGEFDLLLDYGALDDLGDGQRDRYVEQVTPLLRTGGSFLLWCFEWPPRWWERLLPIALAMKPGEVAGRFGATFSIERIAGEFDRHSFPPGYAAYLMTRV